MPKKIYTPNQTLKLDAVRRFHVTKMQRRAELAESIRKEYERQLVEVEVAESRAANEAVLAGVTKKDIAQALGIGNWHTFKDILAMTHLDVEVSIQPVTWHPESRTVTIADFVYGNESVKGGTYPYLPWEFDGKRMPGIEYHKSGDELSVWVTKKLDAIGAGDWKPMGSLINGWEAQAREQGAK